MPMTAYSKTYEKELDTNQLIALFKNETLAASVETLKNIPDDVRSFVHRDAVCPSCGVEGAILVSGASSKEDKTPLRQAHFRFVRENNGDAHREFCEFANSSDDTPRLGGDTKFDKPRTNEQKLIRILVCKAIESGIFNQSDMRSMRQWYFDTKTSGSYLLTISDKPFIYLNRLVRTVNFDTFVHHPSHAELPGFDWKHATIARFSQDNFKILEALRSKRVTFAIPEAAKLVEKFQGKNVFDVTALEPYYQKTIELCTFTTRHVIPQSKTKKYAPASTELLAFCSLLLSISDWSINSAIDKLVKITKAPAPNDLLLGNMIGLNPFHDYSAWRLIKLVKELEKDFDFEKSVEEKISETEALLKAEHLEWRRLNNLPELEVKLTPKSLPNIVTPWPDDADIPF
jgi:hypothetical protein